MTVEQEKYKLWLMDPEGGNVLEVKFFPENGTYAAVKRLLFHYTMIFGMIGDFSGYEKRYCYQTLTGALQGIEKWNGIGDPEGWHRSPETGRRRPDGDAAKEYIEV